MKKKKTINKLFKVLYYITLFVCAFAGIGTITCVIPFISDLASMVFVPFYPYVFVLSLICCGLGVFLFTKNKSKRNIIVFIISVLNFLAVLVMSIIILVSVNQQGEKIHFTAAFLPKSFSDIKEDDLFYLDQKNDKIPLSVFYKDDGQNNKPVIFYTHGGGWVQGSRYDRLDTTKTFVENGYVVICPEYDLSNDEDHFYNVNELQLMEALDYCGSIVSKYGGNIHTLYMVGDSAGGNLALELSYKINRGIYDCPYKVKAVSVIYPVTSIKDFYENKKLLTSSTCKKMAVSYLGAIPGDNPERYELFNPENYINAHTPPTLITLGTADSSVPPQSTYRFYSALQKEGVSAKLIKVPFTNHVGDRYANSFLGQAYINNTLVWFEENK